MVHDHVDGNVVCVALVYHMCRDFQLGHVCTFPFRFFGTREPIGTFRSLVDSRLVERVASPWLTGVVCHDTTAIGMDENKTGSFRWGHCWCGHDRTNVLGEMPQVLASTLEPRLT